MKLSALIDDISISSAVVGLVAVIISKVIDYLRMKFQERDLTSELMELWGESSPHKHTKYIDSAIRIIYLSYIIGSSKKNAEKRFSKSYSYYIFANSSLVSSIVFLSKRLEKQPDEGKSNTIVGIMLGQKIRKSINTQLILVAALFIHLVLFFFEVLPISNFMLLFTTICLSAIHLDHKLIEFRIKKGWYGHNEYEAREIIEFISWYADKDDFNNPDGLKSLFPKPDRQVTINVPQTLGGGGRPHEPGPSH